MQTPLGNLSQGIGWLQTTYTVRFNRRHHRSGHLYQGRFKAHLIEEDLYAGRLALYVHLNPVRPRNKRQVIPADRRGQLARYRWSSHRACSGQATVPQWLSLDWLGYFGPACRGGLSAACLPGRRRQVSAQAGAGRRTKGAARRVYNRQVASCFGDRLPNPFDELRGGLVLAGDGLWERVVRVLERAEGDEEIRWRKRTGRQNIQKRVRTLVQEEDDRRIQIWIRVRLGGQRMTDVARDYGYRDGSSVHRVVQRVKATGRVC